MDYLLYSSKEMFSSTDLIRKSKMIFDKLGNDEINKAIILRDGKPSFIMLEFDKYEAMMKDYQSLKSSNVTEYKTQVSYTKQHTIIKDNEKIVKDECKDIIIKEVVNLDDEEAELLKTLKALDDMDFEDNDDKDIKSLDEFDDEEITDYEDEEIEEDDTLVKLDSKEQPLKDFWEK